MISKHGHGFYPPSLWQAIRTVGLKVIAAGLHSAEVAAPRLRQVVSQQGIHPRRIEVVHAPVHFVVVLFADQVQKVGKPGVRAFGQIQRVAGTSDLCSTRRAFWLR